jgi:hypothetical protein
MDEIATDTFVVSLLELGYNLNLTIIPQQDVIEGEATQLDITPYIKNAAVIGDVEVTVKGSEFVTVNGRVLTFLYELYFEDETETIKVTIREGNFGASRDVVVRILDGEDDFVLTEIPDVTVTETIPETFNIKPYIKNAYNIDFITASTDSPEKVADDVFRITVSDGIHTFSRTVTVHVNRLGKELQLSGIGDRNVFEGSKLVIDLEPYLYNVDEIVEVTVSVSPLTYVTMEGFVATFNFPEGIAPLKHEVTFTAIEGTDTAQETITIFIERVPLVFTFGDIGSITVIEDEDYLLDVEPYLVNMALGVEYVIAEHSDHATVEGFIITFHYDVEVAMDEIVRINVTGDNEDFAEQDLFVHVNSVNDAPELFEPIALNFNVQEGAGAVIINLTDHFTDKDTEKLNFSSSSDQIEIDNDAGTARIVFPEDSPRPDDVVGARITAFDPDDPDSKVQSNAFDIAYYLKDQKPPGPGPGTGPNVNEPEGGNITVLIAILLVAIVGGVGWMYYRKRRK